MKVTNIRGTSAARQNAHDTFVVGALNMPPVVECLEFLPIFLRAETHTRRARESEMRARLLTSRLPRFFFFLCWLRRHHSARINNVFIYFHFAAVMPVMAFTFTNESHHRMYPQKRSHAFFWPLLSDFAGNENYLSNVLIFRLPHRRRRNAFCLAARACMCRASSQTARTNHHFAIRHPIVVIACCPLKKNYEKLHYYFVGSRMEWQFTKRQIECRASGKRDRYQTRYSFCCLSIHEFLAGGGFSMQTTVRGICIELMTRT